MPSLSSLLPLLLAVPAARAHMSIFLDSMYGLADYDALSTDPNPVAPLGPDWNSQDEWWFRGPSFRALTPAARGSSAVTDLVAGGTLQTEIACHIAWTSLGCCDWQPAYMGWTLDACPNNAGAYHSGDPNAETIDDNLLSGCALAIADVDDINKVTMDNLVVFSVQQECVKQKDTGFEIPAAMPACTGSKCICAWFWLANNGTANFYMTAFDCKVTNVSPSAKAIAAPNDPKWCDPSDKSCATQAGAKRPLYAYNQPTNVVWHGNDDRPGYHDNWSFKDGAQNDIFVTVAAVTSAKSSTTTTTTTTSAKTSSATTTSAKTTTTTAARASLVGGAQSIVPTTKKTTTTTTTTTKKTTTTTTKKHTTTTTTSKKVTKSQLAAQKKAAAVASRSSSLSKAKAAARSKAAARKIAVRGVPLYGNELVAERMFDDIFEDDEE